MIFIAIAVAVALFWLVKRNTQKNSVSVTPSKGVDVDDRPSPPTDEQSQIAPVVVPEITITPTKRKKVAPKKVAPKKKVVSKKKSPKK